jgi:hypothetical protein
LISGVNHIFLGLFCSKIFLKKGQSITLPLIVIDREYADNGKIKSATRIPKSLIYTNSFFFLHHSPILVVKNLLLEFLLYRFQWHIRWKRNIEVLLSLKIEIFFFSSPIKKWVHQSFINRHSLSWIKHQRPLQKVLPLWLTVIENVTGLFLLIFGQRFYII